MLNKLLSSTSSSSSSSSSSKHLKSTLKNYQIAINTNHQDSPVAIATEVRINCRKINNHFNIQLKGQFQFMPRCPDRQTKTPINTVNFSGISAGYKSGYQQALEGLFMAESEFHMDRPGRFKKNVILSVNRLINETRDILIGIKVCHHNYPKPII